MKDQIDAFLSSRIERWVAAVERRPRLVVWASVVLTIAFGVYAAFGLGINSDNVRMLADSLPSKIAYKQFSQYFPNLDNALLVVIDGNTTEETRDATDRLEKALAARTDAFTDVYVPGGGKFFERNGLLYRSVDELDTFADQMARLQPVLAQLDESPTIESLSSIIRMGLDETHKTGGSAAQWSAILDQVGKATVTVFDEFPVAVSWEEVFLRGSAIEVAKRRVIIAQPILDFRSALAARKPLKVIRDTAKGLGLTPDQGVRVRVTGNPALNYEEMIGLAWNIGGSSIFCFLMVCAVLQRALRSFRLMVASVATLLMGLVWTAGFATAAVHELNILSLSFAVLFIGLGIDFSIHLGAHYIHLLRSGVPHERALRGSAAQVGSSLVICTITTAIGFYVFLPSQYRGVAELGLIAGTGMLIILALTLTTLPALLCSWLALDPNRPPPADVHFDAPWLRRMSQHGRLIRWLSLAVGIGGAVLVYTPGTHFDSNVIRMRNPKTESVQAFEDLMSMTKTASPWYANSVAPNLKDAEKIAARMNELPEVDHAITLADYVPKNQDEKLEILDDTAYLLAPPPDEGAAPVPHPTVDEQVAALRELASFLSQDWVNQAHSPLGDSMRLLRQRLEDFLARIDTEKDPSAALASLQKVLLSSLPQQIQRLRDAVHAKRITMENLPKDLVRRMLAPTGQARVQIFPRADLQDNVALAAFVKAIRTVDPMVSGISVNLYDFGRATVSSFQYALTGGLVLISLLLFVLWRDLRDVALALAPLLLGGIMTVATMAVFGIRFNFANVIVLPLLLGIGVDSGIHLVHRAKMRLSPEDLLLGTTTARAVFYSALTTVVSFGTLAFSSHRGVASLGVVLTAGMAYVVVCNLVTLPALIELRQRDPDAEDEDAAVLAEP